MDIAFKQRCITLRKEGRSIIEIMRITGRAKTSIYAHIQHIPLSASRMQEIRKASGDHIRPFAIARRGKSMRSFNTFATWTPETVLLVAHLLFDGELMRAKPNYNNRNKVLIARVRNLMKTVYRFEPKSYVNKITGVTRICYFNVALGNYLFAKSRNLLQTIDTFPHDLKREFLRAFFDDEGCMTFVSASKRQVRGYQKDVDILHLIQRLLRDFGIISKIQFPNEVVISGRENLMKFQKEINFSPGVRVNGGRSNSIWKESLEKRELLGRAIKSFKT